MSTAGQAEEGVSLAAQRAKIEAWCSLNDAELVASLSGRRSEHTLCFDDEVAPVGFMSPEDVRVYVSELESLGLHYLAEKCVDLQAHLTSTSDTRRMLATLVAPNGGVQVCVQAN